MLPEPETEYVRAGSERENRKGSREPVAFLITGPATTRASSVCTWNNNRPMMDLDPSLENRPSTAPFFYLSLCGFRHLLSLIWWVAEAREVKQIFKRYFTKFSISIWRRLWIELSCWFLLMNKFQLNIILLNLNLYLKLVNLQKIDYLLETDSYNIYYVTKKLQHQEYSFGKTWML